MPFKIRWRGIRLKIIVWAFVPVAFMLFALGLWNLWSFYGIAQGLMIENNRSTTQIMAGRLVPQLEPFSRQLKTIARRAGDVSNDTGARQALLEESRGSLSIFDAGVVLLDKEGIVLAAQPERAEAIGQNWSNRPYLGQIASASGPILSDITADGPDGSNTIVMAFPVHNPQGELTGTVAGMFRVDTNGKSTFYSVLSRFVTWQDSNYLVSRGPLLGGYFVDHNGRIIYHSDPNQIGSDVSSRRAVQLVLSGRPGPTSTREFRVDGPMSYFSPVPGTSWGLVLDQAPAAVLSFYGRYVVVQSLLFPLTLIIPAIIVAFAARRITNPIANLIAAARQVADGDFSQRVTAQTHDELKDLAEQFNLMSEHVERSYAALKAREEGLASLMEATNRQNDYLAALHETTLGIVSHLDTTELLGAMVERATQLVESLYGWLYLETPDKKELEVRVGTGSFHRHVGLRLKHGQGLAGTIWQKGEPIAVENYQTWPGRSEQFEGDAIGPAMGVPLKSGPEIIGAIGLTRATGSPAFTRDELNLMARFAQLASIALENSRLHTSLQTELAIEAGQRQFLELLARGGNLSETLHALVRIIEGQCPGMLGLILLLDRDGKHLHIGAAVSLPKEYVDSIEGLEIGPMVGSCGTACYRRERVIVEDIATDPRWEGLRELGLRYGLRACWSEPVLNAGGQVVGTFAMYYRHPRAPSPAELNTIQIGAHLVGIAVEQKRAEQALQSAYKMSEQAVQERTHELATLNAIAGAVNRSLDIKTVLNDALEKTMEAMDVEFGSAYQLDGKEDLLPEARLTPSPDARAAGQATASNGGHVSASSPPVQPDSTLYVLTPLTHRGFSQEFLESVGRLPLPANASTVAAAKGEPFTYRVEESVPEGPLKRMLDHEHVRQIISIPLVSKSKFVGVLNLATAAPRKLTLDQLSLLASIGQQVGIAVENARLYDQARESARASERGRLARELHDSVTQSLYSVTLYTEAATRLLKAGQTAEATDYMRDVRQTAQEALREMRLLIFQLRPPALVNSSLAAALQARLDAVESRGGIQATLQVEGEEHLTRPVQEELYNIAQEALNNALKHGRAEQVQVVLRFQPEMTCLEVCDDGSGFETEIARLGGGFGISGMSERAAKIGGRLDIDSEPGKGTRVSVQVPVHSSTNGGTK